MNIVFFGSSPYVLPILDLLRTHFDLSLVVTTEKFPTEAVPLYCKKHAIPYISVDQFDKTLLETIKKQHAEVAVLAYFGIILPNDILTLFPRGIINIHPSLLPNYRGPTPVQTTILHGDSETGVTIIRLDNQVDHGPIFIQEKETVFPSDNTDSLHIRLFEKGAKLLEKTLDAYLKGTVKPREQMHTKATFTNHLTRQSGYIDSTNPPAREQLIRMIKAYYPWPGVWTKIMLNGKQVRMKLLPQQKLQLQDKRPMSYKDFYNGHPEMKGKLQNLLV